MKPFGGILRGALTLGSASALDYLLQFILPVILVRSLDAAEFGQYRILWMLANTMMAFAPMYMPQGLFYFLPRHDQDSRAKYVANVLYFLLCAGLIAAAAGSAMAWQWTGTAKEIPGSVSIVPLFLCLWVISTLVEWLANAEGRVAAQARIIVALSLSRVGVVGGVAYTTGNIMAVFWALTCYAGLRVCLLLYSVVKRYGIKGLTPDWSAAKLQLAYALPFGIAGSLYGFRSQGDQWIVATLFSVEVFAIFSIAGVAAPLAGMVRQAVSNAVLPDMNRYNGQGDQDAAIALNKQSNTLVAFALLPILSFLFVFAGDIISLIYTPAYALAANPMRVYLLGLGGQILVANNLLIIYAQGRFQLRLNLLFLAVAVSLSFAGAYCFGIIGAALGTAVAQWGSSIVSIWHVTKIAQIKANQIVDVYALFQCLLISTVSALATWSMSTYLEIYALPFRLAVVAFLFLSVFVLAVLIVPKYRQTVIGSLRR